MKNLFTAHPHSIGESYFQHLRHASRFGFGMIIGGSACMLHAVLPFMFKNTGSNYLLRMTNDFICRMPRVEERVATLARSIDAKMSRNSPADARNTNHV